MEPSITVQPFHPHMEHLPLEVDFTAEELIAELEKEQHMSVEDFRQLVNPVKRKEIIDPQSHSLVNPNCLRSRAVTLLRLLEDDLRTISNNRSMNFSTFVTKSDRERFGSILNAMVWRHHHTLVNVLMSIKQQDGTLIDQFHDALDNMGYLGGYDQTTRKIRLRHPNMALLGYIEV